MNCRDLVFSGHALRRMFERGIGTSHVRSVIERGEVIAEYPEDIPLPSSLILGFADGVPLHVVVGVERASGTCLVVTVYVPDASVWHTDFRTRKGT